MSIQLKMFQIKKKLTKCFRFVIEISQLIFLGLVILIANQNNFKEILSKVSGLIVGIIQIFYWMAAVSVSSHAYHENGKSYWTSGSAGTFYPWPKPPGMVTVITSMEER